MADQPPDCLHRSACLGDQRSRGRRSPDGFIKSISALSDDQLPGIEPANADETYAQRKEGGDTRQSFKPGGIEEEHFRHRAEHQNERADAPAALLGPGAPAEKPQRDRDGED